MKGIPGSSGKIARLFPFSPAGTLLLALGLFVLVESLITRDPYELILALFALIVLGGLALLSRLQANQFARYPLQWDTSNPLVAGPREAEQRLTGVELRPFMGFRLHFTVTGRLTVGREAFLWLSQTTVASRAVGGAVPVRLRFPLCGLFEASGALTVRDIFGLSRALFGERFERRLPVLPAPHPEPLSVRVEATERSEEKQSQINADEDKYYMREYAPGDRFRDINWKTSSRLAQLITRISPVALEQTKLIAVELRHYRPEAASSATGSDGASGREPKRQRGLGEGAESLESVMHLSYLKGWLLSFLRVVKEAHPDFQFLVTTGRGTTRLSSKEEIDAFAATLAELFYQSEPALDDAVPATDELFIFSTPFDLQLPHLLPSYPHAKIHLFRTLLGTAGGNLREAARSSYGGGGGVTSPAGTRSGGGNTSRQRPLALMHFREQLPLPGVWAFRRERARPGLAARLGGGARAGRRGAGRKGTAGGSDDHRGRKGERAASSRSATDSTAVTAVALDRAHLLGEERLLCQLIDFGENAP